MRYARLIGWMFVGGMLAACTSDGIELVVSLRTDYVPAQEFDEVRLTLPDDARTTASPARGGDYVRGARIADLDGLAPRVPRRLTIELVREGRVIDRRNGRVDHRRSMAVTLWISRACRGIECPEGTTCDSGACVPEDCVEPDECEAPGECEDASDCPNEGPVCAEPVCVGQRCALRGREDACGDAAWCSPDEGCVPLEDDDPPDDDAGTSMPDASVGGEDLVTSLALGHAHTCVHWVDDRVACWGANDAGQLGDGTTTSRARPVIVPDVPSAAVFAGARHTCATGDVGGVLCWGRGSDGQLGDGASDDRLRAVASELPEGVVRGGPRHTCVLVDGGVIQCLGGNERGELGDGTTSERTSPVDVTVDSVVALRTSSVDAEEARTTCAIDADGVVWCWGANGRGQLGDGTLEDRAEPGEVSGLPGPVADLAIGAGHVCAIVVDPAGVYCWGSNDRGQLGRTSAAADPRPGVVLDVDEARGIAAGAAHTCALREDGSVVCWGASDQGQAGVVAARVTRPQVVAGVGGAGVIGCGAAHCCAITGADVRCWGAGAEGQLGDGTRASRPTAQPVPGL